MVHIELAYTVEVLNSNQRSVIMKLLYKRFAPAFQSESVLEDSNYLKASIV